MERNINDAVKLYSGDKPFELFVQRLECNLKKMNSVFDDIFELFNRAGVPDFEKLPEDRSECAKFASLFKELNSYLEAAKIQGFKWDKTEYEFSNGQGKPKTVIAMKFDKNLYSILALRYKELSSDVPPVDGSGEVPYDLAGYLTEIDTGVIDANYMNSRFEKYLKLVKLEGLSKELIDEALDELHKTFSALTQEEQKYANIFLRDIQRGDVTPEKNKTLRDYITEYQYKAKDNQIHNLSLLFGLDEGKLRNILNSRVTEANINEFGRFDELKNSVDKTKAKSYFEKIEKTVIPPFKVNMKTDDLLRRFVVEGGFEVKAP